MHRLSSKLRLLASCFVVLAACGPLGCSSSAASYPGAPFAELPDAAPPDARATDAPSTEDPDELLLNARMYGANIANAVKGLHIAWDGKSGRLFACGTMGHSVTVIDPASGKPVGSIALEVDPTDSMACNLRLDESRRRLFWMTRTSGRMRVIDVDTLSVRARFDPPTDRVYDETRYPFPEMDVDLKTGYLWVADNVAKALVAYDGDLKRQASVEGLEHIVALAADQAGDSLLMIQSTGKDAGSLLRYTPSSSKQTVVKTYGASDRMPTSLAVGELGAIYASAGNSAFALHRDGSEKWRANLTRGTQTILAAGDYVAFLSAPMPSGSLTYLSAETGARLGEAATGYESKSLTADRATGRLFAGNGGSGSVTVIDTTNKMTTTELDVGNSAEGVVVDTKTGSRYIVSRLGGSHIFKWAADDTLTHFSGGAWPVELFIDVPGRLLYAHGHYESVLYRWDLDSGEALSEVPYGAPGNVSDSLSDADVDAEANVAAAVFPETGTISVVNVSTGAVMWTSQLEALSAGLSAGPGQAYVRVDSANDRLYVMGGKPRALRSFVLSSGRASAETKLVERASTYQIGALFLDRANQRIFAGSAVYAAPDLTPIARAVPAEKVFYADPERLLGCRLGVDQHEYVVELDPTTLTERNSWDVAPPGQVRAEYTFEPTTGAVYLSHLETAKVRLVRPRF